MCSFAFLHPDITYEVDWTYKSNYLLTCSFACRRKRDGCLLHSQPRRYFRGEKILTERLTSDTQSVAKVMQGRNVRHPITKKKERERKKKKRWSEWTMRKRERLEMRRWSPKKNTKKIEIFHFSFEQTKKQRQSFSMHIQKVSNSPRNWNVSKLLKRTSASHFTPR